MHERLTVPGPDRSGGMRGTRHLVGAVLADALQGRYPADDGSVEVVPPWRPGVEAVVSFTAHAVVATALPPERFAGTALDAFGGAFDASVIHTLAGAGGSVDNLDVVLLAAGTGQTSLPEAPALFDHPRVRHASAWRQDVCVHGDSRGLVTVARGLGGVAELSFEVPPEGRDHGAGRELLADALGLVPAGEPVVVLVAPGNARSLRAALAAGFTPVGAAQLVRPDPRR